VRLERISNFDELQPLAAEPGVRLRLVGRAAELGRPDLVVLPGSKTTVHDLERLRSSGMAEAILAAHAAGAAVLGICAGYQMLGRRIEDPDGVEAAGPAPGLGLLPTTTRFEAGKVTAPRRGRVLPRPGLLARAAGIEVLGYEIHAGRVTGERRPALDLGERLEGCVSEDGWVAGSSIHGVLGVRALRRAVLESLAQRRGVGLPPPAPEPPDPFEALADALGESLDVGRLDRIIGVVRGGP
jgi:adenosylcobyric acid synthase